MSTPLNRWLEILERRHPRSIDLDLERCGSVYRTLGSPRPAAQVISVAGTNGKGSVVAWLSSLLSAQGLSTGAYTSPHILRFNERLVMRGETVTDAALVAAFERVEEARGDVSLTYFEFTTLACLLLMAEAGLDCGVLEVGLGGRLDTVNLVDADCAVITAVDLDHQSFLGGDRETIGREKAGIMRPGRPVVCGEPQPPDSVFAHARALGCPVTLAGRDYHCTVAGQGMRFTMGDADLDLPRLPLAGARQRDNLAAALATLELCRPGALADGAGIANGVAAAALPGRLQNWPGAPPVLLDVGHNPLAARVVAEHLGAEGPARHCVLGMLSDKDAEGVANCLENRVAHWYCAGLGGARGQSGEQLARRVRAASPRARVRAFDNVDQALAAAVDAARPAAQVLVFGSFLTVAEAMRHLRARSAGAENSGAAASTTGSY